MGQGREGLEKVTGIVLKSEPIGEYDKRVVLLTGERGKIAAFAKGARRQNSRLLAATNPFCFGTYTIFFGRSSYSLNEAEVSNFFPELRDDYELAYVGFFFLELADYYSRENNDEKALVNLLYQSLKALCHPAYDKKLVCFIYEIKALAINGEYPGPPEKAEGWEEATLFTLEHIVGSDIEKLYSFSVSERVLAELGEITAIYRRRFYDKPMKSLEVLESLHFSLQTAPSHI
jgi:DNA repair protein RecO (recombination protein O)